MLLSSMLLQISTISSKMHINAHFNAAKLEGNGFQMSLQLRLNVLRGVFNWL